MSIVINKIKKNSSSYNKFIIETKQFEFNYKYSPFLYKDDDELIKNIGECFYVVAIHSNNIIDNVYIFRFKKKFSYFKFNTDNEIYIKYLFGELYINLNEDYQKEQYVNEYNNDIVEKRLNEFISYLNKSKSVVKVDKIEKIRMFDDAYFNEDDLFRKDYNLIMTSRAFRRLQDKTQIFSLNKGDHFRTRLTHTFEVCEIAKRIASELNSKFAQNINIDIVECIAMGHDIGHTPFGHQGERTLNDIICNNDKPISEVTNLNIIKNASKELRLFMGGFKHNIQSVRVLSQLEEHFNKYAGLNLTYEILEGILKHTDYDIEDVKPVLDYRLFNFLHIDDKENRCITGKIVKISDEIAQRCHDLEDAFKAKIITFDDFLTKIQSRFSVLYNDIKEFSNNLCVDVIDGEDIIICHIKHELTNLFIKDIIANYKEDYLDFGYTNSVKTLDKMIDDYVKNAVISSKEIVENDSIADTIVKYLFEQYYNNPMLLNDNFIRRIYLELLKDDDTRNIVIDFRNMDKKFVRKEIEDIISIDYVDCKNDKNKLSHLKRQCIIIRNICDYISGMTDSFAIEEYNKLKGIL